MRNILFVVIALVAAVGAGWIIRSQLQSTPEPEQKPEVKTEPEPPKPATIDVLVARERIRVGDILSESDVGTEAWPVGSVAAPFFRASQTKPAELAGRAARQGFAEGQPLVRAHLVEAGDRGFLATVLEPGTRAISISTTATSGVAGLIYPGDRVDVLLTRRARDDNSVSQELLSDIRVVAVGQQLAPASGEGGSGSRGDASGGVVTLEVTPKEARRLAVAKRAGEIQLSLRSFAQRDMGSPGQTAGATWLDEVLVGGPVKPSETGSKADPVSIQVIEGDSGRAVEVENGRESLAAESGLGNPSRNTGDGRSVRSGRDTMRSGQEARDRDGSGKGEGTRDGPIELEIR